jgi:hypothetical protein
MEGVNFIDNYSTGAMEGVNFIDNYSTGIQFPAKSTKPEKYGV